MSTNYSALPDCCPHCDRPAPAVHIGQWPSGLRGYTGYGDSPRAIGSWAEWKDYLRSDPHMMVEDEYRKRMSVDEFINLWESMDLATRRRQFDWVAEHHFRDLEIGQIILEPDGYTLTFAEFS